MPQLHSIIQICEKHNNNCDICAIENYMNVDKTAMC